MKLYDGFVLLKNNPMLGCGENIEDRKNLFGEAERWFFHFCMCLKLSVIKS